MTTVFAPRWFRLSRRLCYALLAVCCPIVSAADSQSFLYLISACTNSYGFDTYPAVLHRFDESRGDLLLIRTLVSPEDGTQYVLDDPELRIWVAGYPSIRPHYFTIVHMDAPEKEQIAKVEYDSIKGPVDAKLFAKPNGIAIGVRLSSYPKPDPQEIQEIVVSTGGVIGGDWSDHRYVRAPGPAGGVQPHLDSVIQVFPFADGQLVFRVGGRAVETGITLPPKLRYAPDDNIIATVLTPGLVVLETKLTGTEVEGRLGTRLFRIGERFSGKWHDWTVPGNQSMARNWDNWLAVAVQGSGMKKRRSAGALERRKEATATGIPFDQLWLGTGYFPGTLLLYDVPRRKEYRIETGQGDSEVLLIEKSSVYYRTNDKIWRGRIGADSITDVEMLLKSPVVPDIHWAFRPKAAPAPPARRRKIPAGRE